MTERSKTAISGGRLVTESAAFDATILVDDAGTISGVVATEEMVDAFSKAIGTLSPTLCGGPTLESIKQTIRQASDILVDGTQDPNKECNAVSIGIGFEAVKVTLSGTAVDPPASPDPCAD